MRYAYLIGLLFATVLCGCTRGGARRGSEDLQRAEMADILIASDSQTFVDTRIQATIRLGSEGRDTLRKVLTARLPGDWDAKTLYDIRVLGYVGNAETASYLWRLQFQNFEVPDKIDTEIDLVIEKIKKRYK